MGTSPGATILPPASSVAPPSRRRRARCILSSLAGTCRAAAGRGPALSTGAGTRSSVFPGAGRGQPGLRELGGTEPSRGHNSPLEALPRPQAPQFERLVQHRPT